MGVLGRDRGTVISLLLLELARTRVEGGVVMLDMDTAARLLGARVCELGPPHTAGLLLMLYLLLL